MKSSVKLSKLQHHKTCKKSCTIFRKVGKNLFKNHGFIMEFNDDFIVFYETYDFDLVGYSIFTISSISEIRYNNNDKYYDKIMRWEGITAKADYPHNIDLTNWSTIFKSIKSLGFNVIIENEKPEQETFHIGPITKITDKSVKMRSFDPKGYLDKEDTKFKWKDVTRVQFDERYTNIFSKYLRERK